MFKCNGEVKPNIFLRITACIFQLETVTTGTYVDFDPCR